jgi:hypothetical protein
VIFINFTTLKSGLISITNLKLMEVSMKVMISILMLMAATQAQAYTIKCNSIEGNRELESKDGKIYSNLINFYDGDDWIQIRLDRPVADSKIRNAYHSYLIRYIIDETSGDITDGNAIIASHTDVYDMICSNVLGGLK